MSAVGSARAPRLGTAVALLAAGALGAAWFAVGEAGPGGAWWAFVLTAAAAELLEVPRPRHGELRPVVAVLVALALVGGTPAAVASVAVVGWLAAAVVRRLRGHPVRLAPLAESAVAGWSLPGIAALGTSLVPQHVGGGELPVSVGALAVVTTVTILAPAAWRAVHARNPLPAFRAEVGGTWTGSLAIASTGALAAVAYGPLGAGALLLTLPLVAVRAGMLHHTAIARTYEQTVVAMGRMTELTGHVAPDHGERVAALAVAVARELSASEADVHVIERAAHLHEVGRIATDDPHAEAHDLDIALAGARIVEEAGAMPQVAEIVGRLRDPYRSPGSLGPDPTLPLGSRIVRTACDFDRLLARAARPWEALDELRGQMAFAHDPEVVAALEHVILTDAVQLA